MDEGWNKLNRIIEQFPPNSVHWNEAQNRFHFVDRLLKECLGWQHSDMDVETSDGVGGRLDYQLGKPAKAVLEAKRQAVEFADLPAGIPSRVRKIAPLIAASANFKDAVEQVVTYCAFKGAQIAIVCNGPQLAIFQAITPGGSPLEGECFLFNGFDNYVENFPLIWSLLSPEGITENRAYRDLALFRNPRIPPKASSAIEESTGFRYRSALQENLRALSSLLLEEIEDNPKLKTAFYRECYVPMEANTRHLLLSKGIIASRYKRVGDDGIIPSDFRHRIALDDSGNPEFSALFGKSSSRPIVVIGDVGVGKSSFFENLLLSISSTETGEYFVINIDLGTKATLSEFLEEYILDVIPKTLKRDYGISLEDRDFVTELYQDDLVDFDKSIRGSLKSVDPQAYEAERLKFLVDKIGQRDRHLHASLAHLVNKCGKQIILIIDNADQRSFEIQQEAFLIAQELAATRNLLVFVALRPSTFFLSKTTGALAAYQNRLLTISPPAADQVIEKRLHFALRIAQGEVEEGFLEGIQLNFGNVVTFLNATLRAVRYNDPIRRFLINITGGNTRAVIELITSFCGSPNVDADKIVREESKKGAYKIPLHEFSKHALLGEYAYFHAQSSHVGFNLFDVTAADPREHFLSSIIVAFLSSNAAMKDNDGFMAGAVILEESRKLGFNDDQTRMTLKKLAKKKLIETPHAHYREIQVSENEPPDSFYYRATSIGVYHVVFWAASFAFLDATSIDTPIFDEAVRLKVMERASSFEIRRRYEKAIAFRTYLEDQWHRSNLSPGYFEFSQLIRANQGGFGYVKKAIERYSI